ncbi:hypothetical protein Tco_0175634 [Tanacetum coccineum]
MTHRASAALPTLPLMKSGRDPLMPSDVWPTCVLAAVETPSAEDRRRRIMPPKSTLMTQAAIRRLIKENVDAAIAVERARHVNMGNDARGSGPARGQDAAPAARV